MPGAASHIATMGCIRHLSELHPGLAFLAPLGLLDKADCIHLGLSGSTCYKVLFPMQLGLSPQSLELTICDTQLSFYSGPGGHPDGKFGPTSLPLLWGRKHLRPQLLRLLASASSLLSPSQETDCSRTVTTIKVCPSSEQATS